MPDAPGPAVPEDVAAATSYMLMRLIHPLVDYPERCSVDLIQKGDSTTFVIQVAPEDMEKFCGRNLRTGRSLQVIASAVGMRAQRRFSLMFQEDAGGARTRNGALSPSAGV